MKPLYRLHVNQAITQYLPTVKLKFCFEVLNNQLKFNYFVSNR